MGKQVGTEIEGTHSNIIFYKWKGIWCIRLKGKTGKQAKVAKLQASCLGRASALSARIRKALRPVLPNPGNKSLMYRLNNALQKWLRTSPQDASDNIPSLERFSFHTSDKDKTFDVAMQVSRASEGLLLHIPQFDSPNPIFPLPFHGKIDLYLVAVSCNINDKSDTLINEMELNIMYDGTPLPGREVLIPIQHGQGRLTLLAMSVNKNEAGLVGAMWG